MRASTKRILSIILAFIFFVATFVVYQNLIGPEGAVIQEKAGLVRAKESLFENQQRAVEKVQSLIGQFQNLRSVQESVSLAMPDSQETTRALSQLEAISRSSGANIISLDFEQLAALPSDQSLIKKIGVLQINVGLTGSYSSLKNFVRLLETNVRVANVRELNFARLQNDYGLNVITEVYYQAE